MKKEIVWEKYVDPLGSNLDEVNYPGYDAPAEDEDDYIAMEQKSMFHPLMQPPGVHNQIHKAKPHKVMHTPFGLVTIDTHSLACNTFDFWIMHTNFDISPEVAKAIEKVPGVETLDIMTRYRARIGFPRSPLFDTSETKVRIKRAIIEADDPRIMTPLDVVLSDFDTQTFNNIKNARKNLQAKAEHWSMLVLPNGQIKVVSSDELSEEFKAKTEELVVAQKLVGGEFYSSIELGV